MNIVVCIKQVPNTNEVKLDPVTGTLIREGVPSIINPDDKAGLEAALRLKDSMGAHVTVLSMGPPQADAALREALAMGADEAILVSDRAFGGADTWATSTTIAAAIKNLDYDLIITGRQAIDGDTAQVGPQISEHLGIPNISYAEEIKVEGDSVIVKRQYEDRYHIVKAKMPCLITALTELNKPRYMTPGGIFESMGAHVTVLSMGPPQADAALREALAMGADEAILVSDRAFGGADTWATSTTIAAAIKNLDYDLIITGRQAIDGDTAQVGPQISEHLGIPNISYAEEIKVEGDSVIVKRQYEDRYHIVKAKMPCLITALTELNKPRYMTPGGIFDAYREKEVKVWGLKDITVDQANIGLKGSPTRVFQTFTKSLKAAGTVVQLDPEESANYMIEKLKEKFII